MKQHCNYVHTSEFKFRPSSWQICNIRPLMISSGSALNLNFAHLEASGSIILQKQIVHNFNFSGTTICYLKKKKLNYDLNQSLSGK